MGTDYSFRVAMGYEISLRQVVSLYGQTLPEKSHTEARFDLKTGEKTSVKAVDQEGGTYIILGKEQFQLEGQNEFHEMLEALEKELGAQAQFASDGPVDFRLDSAIILTPKGLYPTSGHKYNISLGPVDASGAYTVEQIVRAAPKLKKFSVQLKKAGFKIGEPVVRIVCSWGW